MTPAAINECLLQRSYFKSSLLLIDESLGGLYGREDEAEHEEHGEVVLNDHDDRVQHVRWVDHALQVHGQVVEQDIDRRVPLFNDRLVDHVLEKQKP